MTWRSPWASPSWPPARARTTRWTGTPRRLDPAVQQEAARRGLSPNMLVEFVDGCKTMIEMAAVSNATGLVPDVRGMHGPTPTATTSTRPSRSKQDGGVLSQVGVVDLRRRARRPRRLPHRAHRPSPPARGAGAARHGQRPLLHPLPALPPVQHRGAADLRHAGDPQEVEHGPARPAGPLRSLPSAKRDLAPGDTLDAIGGTTYYSLIDTYEAASRRLLPIGLAKGARMSARAHGPPITLADV